MWNTDEEAKRLAQRFEDISNRAKFAREFGVPGGGAMIYQHINGLKPISLDAAKAYALGFHCTLAEISPRLAKEVEQASQHLSPSSNTNVADKRAESLQNIGPGPDIKGRIPLISWVKAGMWSEAVDIYEPGYAERWLPVLKTNGQHIFALRVDGDSMTAKYGKSYPDGCIIFVDPDQRSPANGDRIVAKLHDTNQVTFKVFTQDAGKCWLRPLNTDGHPPIFDAFTVIGKVIGKWEDD